MYSRVKRMEIYEATLYGVGCEQKGNRPVLIIQNDVGNLYSPTTIVAMLTSKVHKNRLPTHVKAVCPALRTDSLIELEQIKTLDKSRLTRYIGKITDPGCIEEINRAIEISLAL